MNIWYLRANLDDADLARTGMDRILAAIPRTLAWEKRMRTIGHGARTEMTPEDALDLAAKATPQTPDRADPGDPNGRKPGDRVSVAPDDYGKIAVTGDIVSLSAQHIAIRRRDDRVGEMIVHFPRAGFSVLPG